MLLNEPYLKLLILFICFSTHIQSYGQKTIKSPNHYQVAIPKNWNELDKNKIQKILKEREEQSGIKDVVTEMIIVKSKEFSVPNMQFLFNGMNLSRMKFSEFISLFDKMVPLSQTYVLKNPKISDKIIKSNPSKPLIDYRKNMVLYTLKQEIVTNIGTVIITSANFMANNGIITLNFTAKASEYDSYLNTFLNIINSFKIDSLYIHKRI